MKIESIQIKNVRSFKDQTPVEFHDSMNLLIGPNAGGKSNLLDILTVVIRHDFLLGYQIQEKPDASGLHKQIDRYQPFGDSFQQHLTKFSGDKSQSTITIVLRPSKEDIRNLTTLIQRRADIESKLSNYINGASYHLKFLDSWNMERLNSELPLDKSLSYNLIEGKLQPPSDPACSLFHGYLSCFELVSILDSEHDLGLDLTSCYYYFSPSRGIGSGTFAANLSQSSYTQSLRGYSQATSRSTTGVANLGTIYLASKLRRYEAEAVKKGYESRWDEDKDVQMLRRNLQRLGYDWSLRLIDPSKNIYQGELLHGGKPVDIGEASSGEQEVLNFIFGIFARNLKGGILLVDEPELHLHPQWQIWLLAAFMDINRQYGNQIIICTHSGTFITPESISNVIRVHRDKDLISHIVRVPKGSIASTRNSLHMVNAHNNQKMFFADIVVLVEGIKDRVIFDRLIKLYMEVMEDQSVIEVLEVHGKHNFQVYRQFLESIQVKVIEVADLDYVLNVGPADIKTLFEVNYPSINKDVLKNKGSGDRKVLAQRLEEAIKTGQLEQLRQMWEHVKDRHPKLKNNLSQEEQRMLSKFLKDSFDSGRCILHGGEIEDYLPEDKHSLDNVIELIAQGIFENWVNEQWDECVFRTKLGHCSGVKLGQPNGAKWATT